MVNGQKLINIPELNLEVKFEKWTKSYKELLKNIPKGFRLMKCSEMFNLAELGLIDKITKGKNIYIYLEQLPTDKENNWSRVLHHNSKSSGSWIGSLDNVYESGWVIFVKEE